MNLYPSNIENKLGFDQIKNLISDYCLSPLGQKYVNSLSPVTNIQRINKLLEQTSEFVQILGSGKTFPASNYLDVTAHLKKSEIIGSFLDEEALFDIKSSLLTINNILSFLKSENDLYPRLIELTASVQSHDALYDLLDASIDEKGKVRDNASPQLVDIRSRISKSGGKARNAVTKIMKEANAKGYCPEGSSITIRDGRIVIPVLAEYKRRIKGFVHDESSTGQTVYLEPAEALEINNELRELEYEERREVIRILTGLTDEIRDNVETMQEAWKFLGIIDFIRAKARFAVDLDGVCPKVTSKQHCSWIGARHPILQLSLEQQGKSITPLNIKIGGEGRILLISGPNAGGKSVCLKTLGLLQFMVQCGLPVPCEEQSEFGVFHSIFMDIGDEQSLENDLSTYSSHLQNMKYFVEHGDKRTIFLIDEFGTGTEPQFGGAIAEAILIRLNQAKATGAVTTHYGNLKKLADKTNGILNGSMKYDVKRLEPLYHLEIGKPGSSFALEIAGKIGLETSLLNHAKNLAGHSHVKFDRLINELEAEKNELKARVEQLEKKEKRLDEAIRDYHDLKAYLDEQKSQAVKQAKLEASKILKDSNKKIEATIREIQQTKAAKKQTQEARNKLREHEEKLEKEIAQTVSISTVEEKFKVGDKVAMKGRETVGEILVLKGKKAEIAMGSIKSLIKLEDLELISNKAFKDRSHEKVRKISGIDINAKMASFSSNLDIRGVRAEEAIGQVENFVDEALLLGHSELRIIHGKGHGILRETIRNVLRENPRIEKLADEHVELGGSGVTLVRLKVD